MIVIADSNEQATSKRTLKELREIFPNFMVSKLSAGDLNVILDDGSILAIERKEIHDFLGSIGDGRVFKQVEMMAASAKYYAIVIEGSLQINYDSDMVVANGELTNWKGASVRAALFSIMWSGCPVMYTPRGCYAETVQEMIKIVSKDDERLQRIHRRIITFPPIGIEQDILMAFPGIGFKRAEALMEYCKSMEMEVTVSNLLCLANTMELVPKEARPPGWGNAVVREMRKTLGLQENHYLDVQKRESEDD